MTQVRLTRGALGLEPESLSPRTRDLMLRRMVPFVENNYNAVELGPRGTGKRHLFHKVSPYAHRQGDQGVQPMSIL